MRSLSKLFGGIKIPWKLLLPFSVIIGIYTGIVLSIPALHDTSVSDIGIGFEWWILFAMIIISNAENPLEAAIKTFVFFLISQPIVFLVQPNGIDLFQRYYFDWFIYTLFTFPMAFVGWYTRKEKIISPFILSFVLVYLSAGAIGYFRIRHILSALFCIAVFIVLVLGTMKNRKLQIIAAGLGGGLGVFSEILIRYLNSR